MIDALIILFILFSVYRGREVGFARQAFSAVGFFGGIIIGAWLQQYTVTDSMNQTERSLMALLTTLGCALVLLSIGEYAGLRAKQKVKVGRIDKFDNVLGGGLAIVSILFSFWLLAAAINSLALPKLNEAIDKSRIISTLNDTLPDAPTFISNFANLINPNGFPRVFIDNGPTPRTDINLPALGEMRPAVEATRDSVVKIEGEGCGGIVDGSGFVAGNGFVVTNAHVVAGIKTPYVKDVNGTRRGVPVWFDPNLDFAVLRAPDLAGKPLVLARETSPTGTPGAVLGYPNGGDFNVSLAAILDQFIARGRNIYDRGNVERDVYEIKANVVSGNSGGPLINKEGAVMGVVFAQSTSHDNVGYALTNNQVREDLSTAMQRNRAVSTGQCTAD